MNRLSSTRLRLAPIPPILISSSAWLSLRGRPTAALPRSFFGGPQHRLDDVLVAGAAAQVARQRPAHLVLGRVGVLVEQRLGGQHHARRAEPALQAVLLLEALLDRVQLARPCQPLDGGDLVAVGLHGEHRAALHRRAVEEHGAGAAVGGVAAGVGAGQPEALAQQVGQQQPGLDVGGTPLAVDRDGDPAHRDVASGAARGISSNEAGHARAASSTVDDAGQDALDERADDVPLVLGAAAVVACAAGRPGRGQLGGRG